MGIEYRIKFSVPPGYDPSNLLKKLPSPIDRARMIEIYNYSVDENGFYFIDHLVDDKVASVAFRRFINEALLLAQSVEIFEP